MARNYYAVLGIPARASQADVKNAYRRLAKAYHPDRYAGSDRPFQDVQQAYSVLGDAGRRRKYDAELCGSRSPGAACRRPFGTDPEPLTGRGGTAFRSPEPLVPERGRAPRSVPQSILERFFSGHREDWRDAPGSAPPLAGDLTVDIPLTVEQCRRGGRVRVAVPARAVCPACLGYGGLGLRACPRCAGGGLLLFAAPLTIPFPAGIRPPHAVRIPLDRFGLDNRSLTARFFPGVG